MYEQASWVLRLNVVVGVMKFIGQHSQQNDVILASLDDGITVIGMYLQVLENSRRRFQTSESQFRV